MTMATIKYEIWECGQRVETTTSALRAWDYYSQSPCGIRDAATGEWVDEWTLRQAANAEAGLAAPPRR
jgi:hypothetical protein